MKKERVLEEENIFKAKAMTEPHDVTLRSFGGVSLQ
jgi:hypothetical protein